MMITDNICSTYVESSSEFTVIAHLHIDPLIKTETDQVQWLFYCIYRCWLE